MAKHWLEAAAGAAGLLSPQELWQARSSHGSHESANSTLQANSKSFRDTPSKNAAGEIKAVPKRLDILCVKLRHYPPR